MTLSTNIYKLDVERNKKLCYNKAQKIFKERF